MPESPFKIRVLRIGEILDEGFKLFRHGFGRFILFQLILYIPSTLALGLLLNMGGNALIDMLSTGTVPDMASAIASIVLSVLGVVLIETVIGSVSTVALTRGIAATYLSKEWTVGSVLRETLPLAPRAIGAGLLLALILMVCMGLPLGLLAGGAGLLVGSGAEGIMGALALLVFALVILLFAFVMGAGIFLRYSMTYLALSLEGTSIIESFSRSAKLMSGLYPRALGLGAILVMVGALLGGVLSAFIPTPPFEGVDPDELRVILPQLIRSQILSSTLGQAVGLFTNTYTVICWSLFYFTARCEKEGFDLAFLAGRH